jgi:hypothetical protein
MSLQRFLFVTTLFIALVADSSARVAGQTGTSTAAAQKPASRASSNSTSVPRLSDGHPDLQGIWSSATVTPLERPKEFANKEVLTEAEATEYEKVVIERNNVDRRDDKKGTNQDVTLAYNDAWWDRGTRVVPTRRTSLVIDPPDGKLPELTEYGKQRQNRMIPYSGFQDGRILASWLDRGLWERCITRGIPDVMLPTAYNNNYQILQTPHYVAILAEMIHDARIIPTDGRKHVGSTVRQWMGDSVGRWEGDTLVVDTTNFTDKTSFRGSGETLHIIERFTRINADVLDYQVTVDDPKTFTRSWTVDLPARRGEGPIYEYACHEGNYAMEHALSGSRAAEKAAGDAGKKKEQ